ncbi:uncharacterized protein DFL_006407 [Arthrobotrys flagrans]|uniref:F-box domain-containing protein n=1 Tax=Arthrobotrys flagrans TaxID=97331 RepID=A0A437A0A9_ARTFL|nr:hypothetical protein DFL_006407 [Arthrobotrys flagrans]
MHHPPTFLSLPPELRLKIYSYLLTSYTPPSPNHLNTRASLRPKYPRFAIPYTSILRVNKQVHNEASRVLYGDNEFAVWISIMGEWVSSTQIENGEKGRVVVGYSSPWDSHGLRVCFEKDFNEKYSYRQSSEMMSLKYYPNGYFDPSIPELKNPNQWIHPLPERYARCIRKLRIEIFEERITPSWDIAYVPIKKLMSPYNPQFLLLPIFNRLFKILGDDRQNIEVEAILYAALSSDPNLFSGGRWDEQDGFEEAVKIQTTYEEYKGLIRTIWPLTRGGWKWRIRMPEILVGMFGDEMVGRVMEECDEIGRGEMGEKEVGVGGECMWVMVGGRRVVVLRTVRCKCGK